MFNRWTIYYCPLNKSRRSRRFPAQDVCETTLHAGNTAQRDTPQWRSYTRHDSLWRFQEPRHLLFDIGMDVLLCDSVGPARPSC